MNVEDADEEDDGLFGTPRDREFFDGAQEMAPTPPQPVERIPTRQISVVRNRLVFKPFDTRKGTAEEVCEVSVEETTPDGVKKVEVARDRTLFYGQDGVLITPASFRRSPKTGLVFSAVNESACAADGVKCYAAEMVPDLFDPDKRICRGCAEEQGLL